MKKKYSLISLLVLSSAFVLLSVNSLFAQKKVNWHTTVGIGLTDLRNFSHKMDVLQYNMHEQDASLEYRLKTRPDFLVNAGLGISGIITSDQALGWDAGINLRSGGFRLSAELAAMEGSFDSEVIKENIPKFGKTESFRYWAVHLPLSLNYLPFEVIGFTIGADVYYQLSSNPTSPQFPHGKLGQTMGFSSYNTPNYQHPLHLGSHLGVYAPIGEKLRLDLQFMTDISPRLTVNSPVGEDWKFREMGLMMNLRYNLSW